MSNSVVLVDPFDGRGHHIHYATTLAYGLSRQGWDIFIIGGHELISSIENVCSIKGKFVLTLTGNISGGIVGELQKYLYLRKVKRVTANFGATIIHLLTLDRMIGAVFLASFRDATNIKNLRATLHWGNMILSGCVGWLLVIRETILKYMLNYLIDNGMVLIMHSRSLISCLSQSKGRVGYVPYPHNIELLGNTDCKARKMIRVREIIPEEAVVLFCFGATRRDKGSDKAVRVLSHLPDNYYLLIVGQEDEITRDELVSIAKEQDVLQRVRFHLSYVTDQEMISYFLASDILLLPYLKSFSGQSGPLVTAATIGLPIVATPAMVLKETIEEYKLGLASESDDEGGLASAVIKINVKKLDSMLHNKFVREHSAATFLDKVVELYSEAYE